MKSLAARNTEVGLAVRIQVPGARDLHAGGEAICLDGEVLWGAPAVGVLRGHTTWLARVLPTERSVTPPLVGGCRIRRNIAVRNAA